MTHIEAIDTHIAANDTHVNILTCILPTPCHLLSFVVLDELFTHFVNTAGTLVNWSPLSCIYCCVCCIVQWYKSCQHTLLLLVYGLWSIVNVEMWFYLPFVLILVCVYVYVYILTNPILYWDLKKIWNICFATLHILNRCTERQTDRKIDK